jgi:hypothetical protein
VIPILPRSARLDPAERCLPQPKPRGFGLLRLPAGFGRKSPKIGGTGLWSRGAQMLGGSNFAAFCASQSGGALPPSAEAPRICLPAVTGRFCPEKQGNRGNRPLEQRRPNAGRRKFCRVLRVSIWRSVASLSRNPADLGASGYRPVLAGKVRQSGGTGQLCERGRGRQNQHNGN